MKKITLNIAFCILYIGLISMGFAYVGEPAYPSVPGTTSKSWGHGTMDDSTDVPDQQQRRVPVPYIEEMTLEAATDALAQYDLSIRVIGNEESSLEPGRVVRQDPVEGTIVIVGSVVSVTISERILVDVPNLSGHFEHEADAILRENRLRLGVVSQRESDREPERIIDQDPPVGSTMPVGTAVSVVVAIPRPGIGPDEGRQPTPPEPPKPHDGQPKKPGAPPPALNWQLIAIISILAVTAIGIGQIRRRRTRKRAKGRIKIKVHPKPISYEVTVAGEHTKLSIQERPPHTTNIEPSGFINMELKSGASSKSVSLLDFLDAEEIRAAWASKSAALDKHQKFGEIRTKLMDELHDLVWGGVKDELLDKFIQSTDVDLVELILEAWIKHGVPELYRKLKKAAKGAEVTITLASHSIKSNHTADVEVLLRAISLGTITFHMKLSFKVDAFILKVKDKKITEIHTGKCTGKGTILCEDIDLYELGPKVVEFPGKLFVGKDLIVLEGDN